MNKEELEKIKKYNFFGLQEYPSEELKKHVKLKYGHHQDDPPLVSILILTYKRESMLKLALKSAINQKDYDDYEIIVLDNGGISNEISDTEKLVRGVNNDKIVYYQQDEEFILRNKELNLGVANAIYLIANSKWVCLLHDDDVLSSNYLSYMMGILNKYPDIEGLMSNIEHIKCPDNDNDLMEKFMLNEEMDQEKIYRISEKMYPGKYVHYVLGALMKRENIFKLGGYPVDCSVLGLGGMADFVFAVKYACFFKTFFSEKKCYGYRISPISSSAKHSIWTNIHICRFFFMKAIADRYAFPANIIMEKSAEYELIDNVKSLNDPERNIFNDIFQLDEDYIFNLCGVKTYRGAYEKIRRKTIDKFVYYIRKLTTSKDIR